MSRVLVLGAGGLLGRHLIDALLARGVEVVGRDRAACDITDPAAVGRAVAVAEVVVNCAAYTNVDGAEREQDRAWQVNALGAELVGRAAAMRGVRAVHISTDFVFDGTKATPYDELDRPNPLSVYARSKWAGEEMFLRQHPQGLVVRVQGLYGRGGSNFASKLPELLRSGRPLKLDAERRVQPTWAGAAAAQLVRILHSDAGVEAAGVVHLSCTGEATWAAFTRRLAQKLALPFSAEEVASAALGAPAARPPNCLFEHRMLRLRGLYEMPSWEAGQDGYVADVVRQGP